jgi:hypothetical protein
LKTKADLSVYGQYIVHKMLISGCKGSSPLLAYIFFLFLLFPEAAEAVSGLSGVTSRNFVLKGDIAAEYERRWDNNNTAENRFRHDYHFELDGFVVSPSLLLFEVRGEFSQDIYNPGITFDSYGFGTTLSFLNRQIRRGPLMLLPQPIILSFDYYRSEDTTNYTYGLTLFYELPLSLGFFREGKIISLERGLPQTAAKKSGENDNEEETNNTAKAASKGLLIPFPRIYLDYNGLTSTSSDSDRRRTDDHLNIRADTETEHGRYRLNYQYERTSDTVDKQTVESRKHWLDLYADFQFLNKEKAEQLDIYNQFSYSSIDSRTFTELLSRGVWVKRFGPGLQDSASILAAGSYTASDSINSYAGALEGSYSRFYTERFYNSVSVGGGYSSTQIRNLDNAAGDSSVIFTDRNVRPSDNVYTVNIANNSTYVFPKIFTLSGNVAADFNDRGQRAGLGLSMATRTRIATSTYLNYYHIEQGAIRSDNQKIGFNFSGGLLRNVYITSMNYYELNDSSDLGKEKRLYLRGDVYWFLLPYQTSFGVVHQAVKRDNSVMGLSLTKRANDAIDISSTTAYATVSRSFNQKLTLMERISYTRTNIGQTSLTFDSSLTWIFRRFSLIAQYSLNRQESDHGGSDLHQRFFVSIRRDFNQLLRPFF